MMENPSPFKWVSVDGVDFAGKSVLADRLASELRAVKIPEFSSSPLGRHLEDQVKRNPHFIEHSPIGQSLMFLADHADLAARAASVRSGGHPVVQDRGILSKFVYQVLVLRSTSDDSRARALVSSVLGELPLPDVTVFLDIDSATLRRRHFAARGAELGLADEQFLLEAMAIFREEVASGSLFRDTNVVHIVPGSDEDADSVAARVLADIDGGLGMA